MLWLCATTKINYQITIDFFTTVADNLASYSLEAVLLELPCCSTMEAVHDELFI